MAIPLVCFLLGALVFAYAVFAYAIPLFHPLPEGRKRSDFVVCLASYLLIAVALMLGLLGYFSHLNSKSLRYTRLGMAATAVIFLSYEFLELVSRP
ncbi:hypothetical protein IFO70_04285 [Phormidium tenue FACHB-886]|nr:hypothetical protein [Phormidium tenue FACHB-886]